MKILIWSAFAMSLLLTGPELRAQSEAVDDFLGLESELLPELTGHQRFTSTNFHEAQDLVVKPENVIQETEPLKGQNYSIIPWSQLEPEEWLNFTTWKTEREIKDKIPDWKIRLRKAEHLELMGKVLQCAGKCEIFRGKNSSQAQHLSQVMEGDELKTGKNTVAWVFLMDGSLLRLSPESSVSMQEINITKNEIFFLTRLNHGHAFWHSRDSEALPLELSPETDSLSLPLLVREANQEFFERKLFQKQTDETHLSEVIELEETAVRNQFSAINAHRTMNKSKLTLNSKFMMVTSNFTIVASGTSFDFFYLPGAKSFFKKRFTKPGEDFSIQLRGYAGAASVAVTEMNWHEVEINGRSFSPIIDAPGTLHILELLTKRIKSIELAREIWIEKFSLPILASVQNEKLLATEHGYTLWGDDHSKRFHFLSEYTRRIETTNLRSLENLLKKLEEKGEKIVKTLEEDHYRVSLNHYLFGLKSRFSNKEMRVREFSDLQYYVWILKNGKF